MARGYPDWRPPSENITVSLAFVSLSAAGDVIAAPGAGFRIALHALWMNEGGSGLRDASFIEATPANVTVRDIGRIAFTAPTHSTQYQYFGLPFAEGNKLRQIASPGGVVEIFALYTIEAV